MNRSQGRAGRTGRFWLGTALAASGLLAAVVPGTSRACHIRHDTQPAGEQATPSPAAGSSMPTSPASGDSAQGPGDSLDHWAPKPPATAAQVLPAATTATPPAAEMLAPSTPTVANQGTSQPCGCPPPPPCSATPPATASSGANHVPNPASQNPAPASSLLDVKPTPEPSTVVSALALIGAVAWRRRAGRPRA